MSTDRDTGPSAAQPTRHLRLLVDSDQPDHEGTPLAEQPAAGPQSDTAQQPGTAPDADADASAGADPAAAQPDAGRRPAPIIHHAPHTAAAVQARIWQLSCRSFREVG